MAQAWTAEDFGNSESKVIVAAPVITELNTPRFLAGGDTSRLTLDITNLTDKPQTLNVALAAKGLLALESEQPKPVNVAPGARMTLFIPVRALDGYGDGEVTAAISGLTLPGKPSRRRLNRGKSVCVRLTRHRPSAAMSCSIRMRPGMHRLSIRNVFRQ
jgi:uncharacterized protein YfaS (alpha-2-macroglobulin family)